MIESLRLQNFKGHRDTTIELGRLTVLVGPNGSGKTSVLQALQILSQLVMKPVTEVFRADREPEFLVTRGTSGPIKFEAARRSVEPWYLDIELGLRPRDVDGKLPWSANVDVSGKKRSDLKEALRSSLGPLPLWPWLANTNVYRFDARKIAAPGYSEDTRGRVEPDGKNTAAALAALKLGNDEAFDAVVRALRAFVPAIERIRFKPARVTVEKIHHQTATETHVRHHEVSGHSLVFDFKGAPDLPAHAASEGTLVLLALLTALYANGPSGLILIDDIEHSLHPTAQIELMKHLRELLAQMPDLQIVATTHSPYILDGVDPADVRVFYPRDDGTIITKRLSDHPDAKRMKGVLSSGEFWSAESEAWVLGKDTSA